MELFAGRISLHIHLRLILIAVLRHFYFLSFIPSDIVFYLPYFSLAYFIVLLLGTPERWMGVCWAT